MPPVITITTDFGLDDPFVGILKGVILNCLPNASIVDITHQVEPQNIKQAALILNSAYPFFPKNTVHLVVVDPGVGGSRRPIAAKSGSYTFVGPDNGVFTSVLKPGARVYELTQTRYFLKNISSTFHGRDIFAPATAWIAKGTPLSKMGRRIKDPKTIRVGEESEPVDSIRQMYCEVARRDKLDALREVFETIDAGEQTLVFRRTQEDVDWLVRMLKQKGVAADAIHGGLRQSERNAVMQAFRDGKVKLLVSTNLTSRGIDVPAVAHVINYDIPEQVEEYVHRIGRTARMGRDGTAVTFVAEWDIEFFDAIRNHVGADKLEEIHLNIYNRGKPATTVVAEPEEAEEPESTDELTAPLEEDVNETGGVDHTDAEMSPETIGEDVEEEPGG